MTSFPHFSKTCFLSTHSASIKSSPGIRLSSFEEHVNQKTSLLLVGVFDFKIQFKFEILIPVSSKISLLSPCS